MAEKTSSLIVKDPRANSSEISGSIPHIFSVKPKPDDHDPRLKEEFEFINSLIDLLLEVEQSITKLTDSSAADMIDHLEKTRRALKRKVGEEKSEIIVCYIEFIKAYISGRCFDSYDPTIKFLRKKIPDDSLSSWYKVVSFFVLIKKSGHFGNDELNSLIENLSHIKCEPLRSGTITLIFTILSHYELKEYLFNSAFNRLAEILVGDPGIPYLASIYAEIRYKFVLKNLIKNKVYFLHVNSPLLSREKSSLNFNVHIIIDKSKSITDKKIDIGIELDELKMLKFVSHFGTISFPIPEFCFVGVSKKKSAEFNRAIITELKEAGFISSSRMIVKKKAFKTEGGVEVASEDFSKLLSKILKKYSGVTSESTLAEKVDEFINEYRDSIKKRNCLAVFIPIHALALFYSVVTHSISGTRMLSVSSETLVLADPIQNLIQDCLAIAASAEIIKKSDRDDPTKHMAWFRLAESVMNKLWEVPKDLIVQVGTPIKTPKTYSEHAFYVIFKYHASTRQFQIILVNGGPGLSFHERDPSLDEKEFADPEYGSYKPVVSALFAMTDANKDFLKHYLYRLIVLAYTPNLKGLMGNIYFSNDTFEGCGLYNRASIPQVASSSVYNAQLSENCTIHNFKKALELALEIKPIVYYEFEVWLLQLLDSWIDLLGASASKTPEMRAASGGAGSGGLFDSTYEEMNMQIVEDISFFATSPLAFFTSPRSTYIPFSKPVGTNPYLKMCGTKFL